MKSISRYLQKPFLSRRVLPATRGVLWTTHCTYVPGQAPVGGVQWLLWTRSRDFHCALSAVSPVQNIFVLKQVIKLRFLVRACSLILAKGVKSTALQQLPTTGVSKLSIAVNANKSK